MRDAAQRGRGSVRKQSKEFIMSLYDSLANTSADIQSHENEFCRLYFQV